MRSGSAQLLLYWRSTPLQRILVAVNLGGTACALPAAMASYRLLFAHGLDGASLAPFGCAVAQA